MIFREDMKYGFDLKAIKEFDSIYASIQENIKDTRNNFFENRNSETFDKYIECLINSTRICVSANQVKKGLDILNKNRDESLSLMKKYSGDLYPKHFVGYKGMIVHAAFYGKMNLIVAANSNSLCNYLQRLKEEKDFELKVEASCWLKYYEVVALYNKGNLDTAKKNVLFLLDDLLADYSKINEKNYWKLMGLSTEVLADMKFEQEEDDDQEGVSIDYYDEAIDYYKKVLEFSTEKDDKIDILSAMYKMMKSLIYHQRYKQVMPLLDEFMSIGETLDEELFPIVEKYGNDVHTLLDLYYLCDEGERIEDPEGNFLKKQAREVLQYFKDHLDISDIFYNTVKLIDKLYKQCKVSEDEELVELYAELANKFMFVTVGERDFEAYYNCAFQLLDTYERFYDLTKKISYVEDFIELTCRYADIAFFDGKFNHFLKEYIQKSLSYIEDNNQFIDRSKPSKRQAFLALCLYNMAAYYYAFNDKNDKALKLIKRFENIANFIVELGYNKNDEFNELMIMSQYTICIILKSQSEEKMKNGLRNIFKYYEVNIENTTPRIGLVLGFTALGLTYYETDQKLFGIADGLFDQLRGIASPYEISSVYRASAQLENPQKKKFC